MCSQLSGIVCSRLLITKKDILQSMRQSTTRNHRPLSLKRGILSALFVSLILILSQELKSSLISSILLVIKSLGDVEKGKKIHEEAFYYPTKAEIKTIFGVDYHSQEIVHKRYIWQHYIKRASLHFHAKGRRLPIENHQI